MKKIFGSISTAFALWINAFTALAEPIPVQSGEHPAFTRLVLLRAGTGWDITQTGREVVLQFEGYDRGFDTTRIFDFVPRTRIAGITTSTNSMTLALACDCVVGAFIERDAYVVIDVATSSADLQTAVLVPAEIDPTDTKTKQLVASNQRARPLLNLGVNTKPAMPLRLPLAMTADAPAELSQTEQDILVEVEERLGKELTTATGRGVLKAVPDISATTRTQIDTHVFNDAPRQAIDAPKSQDTVAPGTNLRISTSRDLPGTFRDLNEIISESGLVCPSDSVFDIVEWGTDQSFATQMANARQGLYGEFDRLDPESVQRLVRAYLFFGFGAEAREILNLAPDMIEDADILRAMARVLDGQKPINVAALARFKGCDGTASLWAMLTLPNPPTGSLPNSDPALRQLNALPVHLRNILAPMVSNTLLAYGDSEGAATALRSLERLPSTLPPEAKMAQAAIALEDGDVKEGTDQLQNVVVQNAQQSPRALIALVQAKAKANKTIDPETTSLIEAYAREMNGTELGPDLLQAHVIALAGTGEFDTAFELRAANRVVLPANDAGWLNAYMMRKLTANSDDVTFLEHGFSQAGSQLKALPVPDLLSLTRRVLELGFAAQAEVMLAYTSAEPFRAERQILAARISLEMDKPFKAIADLLNVTGPQADGLRADAKRVSGAHDEAHQLYAQANRMQDANEAAWLSENWRDLTPEDTPLFGPMARLDATTTEQIPGTTGMLAHSASLLAESAEARAALQSLLQADDLQVTANKAE